MYSTKSCFFASLLLASGSHAAGKYSYQRSPECTPVTVNLALPTKSFVSPEDAACTQTYTTVLPSLATGSDGHATALKPHTYTMTWECECSPASPCTLPASPEDCPPGFTVTKTVCVKCAGGPKTYTLTIPEPASSTGEPSGKTGGSGKPKHPSEGSPAAGEAGKPYNPEPKPTHLPESSGGHKGESGGKPKKPTGEPSGNAGGSGESEHSSGDSPAAGSGGHAKVPGPKPSDNVAAPGAHNGTTAHGEKPAGDVGNKDGGGDKGGEPGSDVNRTSESSLLGFDVMNAMGVLLGSVMFLGIM